ncbi:MAG: ABC transporter ATP-binding protein [Myxococcota bacterium]
MSSPTTDKDLFRRLLPFLRPDAGLYTAALALAPVTALLVVAQPILLKSVIDDHVMQGDAPGAQAAALWYLAAVVGAFTVQVGHQLSLSFAASRTITHVRNRIYRHTLGLGQSYFDKEPTGRLLTRATNDVEALGETLTAGAITILLDALQVIGVLAAMFWLDWRLTLVLLLVAPPLAIIVNILRTKLRTLYIEIRTSLSELNAYLSERLTGVETVQLYRDEERSLALFDVRLHRYRDANIRTNVFDALLYAVVDGLSSVTMALMLWYGAQGSISEGITAGLLAAFLDYIAKLFRPVQEFSQKIAVIQRAVAALQKIFGLLDVHERVTGGTKQPASVGRISLRELTFAYGDGPTILHGITLDVAPSEVLAIVGRTGSGKTTIGKVLTAAYGGYEGSVLLDGHELAELDLAHARQKIGAVRQDVQLFPGTVRFNLTMGREIPDSTIHTALDLAHATEIVARLGGLDGVIEQQGRNLSAGEAQLLSFARTMIFDPDIVVLDEATASVDSLTEAKLQAATEAILSTKTTLVIAHRLSTIVNADRIAVLDAGEVIELGRHEELLAAGGPYARLFEQQFAEVQST